MLCDGSLQQLAGEYNITMSIMNDVLVCKISPPFIYPKQLEATSNTRRRIKSVFADCKLNLDVKVTQGI